MGFLAPAVPWIIKGGAMLGGSLFGKMAQGSAMKRSGEESTAISGAQNSAGALTQAGTSLLSQGQPYSKQAGDYYSTLLGGNRAAMSQATAAPRAAITDIYRGAEHGLERSGVRGAARDVATADLGRDRASRIAGLTTGVQPAAAGALAHMGSNLTSQGMSGLTGAGSIWQNLLGAGFQNRAYGRHEGEKAGTGIGSLIFDILSGTMGKKSKGSFEDPDPWRE